MKVEQIGWAHAISEARTRRIGKTAEQVVADFRKYAEALEIEREGILVIGLNALVKSE